MEKLSNPKETIQVLQKHEFQFKKKFGQNFLIDSNILESIVSATDITKDDFVLEIGPGIGTMTQYLCENAREVVAVEIDKSLIPILQDTLSEYNTTDFISLLHTDNDSIFLVKTTNGLFNINGNAIKSATEE